MYQNNLKFINKSLDLYSWITMNAGALYSNYVFNNQFNATWP